MNNYREVLDDREYCSLMKSHLDKGYYYFVHPVMLYGYGAEDFIILNFSGERGNIRSRVLQKTLMEVDK